MENVKQVKLLFNNNYNIAKLYICVFWRLVPEIILP